MSTIFQRGGVHAPDGTLGRRRLTRLLLVLAAVLAAGALAAPWLTPTERIRRMMTRSLAEMSRQPVDITGRVGLALLPYPRLKAEGVRIGTVERPMLLAGAVRAELRPLALLTGRLEATEWSVSEADIRLLDTPDGDWGWPGLAARLQIPDATLPKSPRIGRVVVRGSTLRIAASDGSERVLADVNAVARWPRIGDAFELSVTGAWRGETFEWSSTGPRPMDLARSQPSPAQASVRLGATRLRFEGSVAAMRALRAEGSVALSGGTLRTLADLAGVPAPAAFGLQPIDITGWAQIMARAVTISSARVKLGDAILSGGVAARFGAEGPLLLNGTLAGDDINLTPLVAAFATWRTADGAWSSDAFDLAGLRAIELDLRLSAARARIGPSLFEQFAASAILSGGRLDINILNAGAWKGQIKSRLTAAPGARGLDLKWQIGGERVDLGQSTLELFGGRRLSGQATGQAMVEATGESPLALARALEGRATLNARSGELIGVGLVDMLRRMERTPLAYAGEGRGGRTGFDTAGFAGRIAQGRIEIGDGILTGPGYRIGWTGRIDLSEQSFGLRGVLQRPDAANGAGLPFEILGPWASPRFAPDVRALIRRSGAAAPLLNRNGAD